MKTTTSKPKPFSIPRDLPPIKHSNLGITRAEAAEMLAYIDRLMKKPYQIKVHVDHIDNEPVFGIWGVQVPGAYFVCRTVKADIPSIFVGPKKRQPRAYVEYKGFLSYNDKDKSATICGNFSDDCLDTTPRSQKSSRRQPRRKTARRQGVKSQARRAS